MLSYGQVAVIFILIWVVWWCVKKLLFQQWITLLDKRKICVFCLDKGSLKEDVAWKVNDADSEETIYLCDFHKKEQFPGPLGEAAEEVGKLIRNK